MPEIKSKNVRFYIMDEEDRRAWEILHSAELSSFSSQNDFIIYAINDYYERYLAVKNDAYLETREKEDVFADKIVKAVEAKVLANVPALEINETILYQLMGFMKSFVK